MKRNLIERVLKTIRSYDMLKSGDTVVAAVSGGPDSLFLLHALVSLKRKFGIKKIAVCNLDHGLRGEESRRDSKFVKRAAAGLGLEFIHKRINLSKAKSKKLSMEELARSVRYKFYKEAAGRAGATVIATGHTLDDQAETVLMRLVKGASLKGAVGILPVRREGEVSFIRPLLGLEKREIEEYLTRGRIGYRIDRTNLEDIYFRNVVRSEIIPFLERYNPRLKRVLSNFAEHLREDFEFIENEKSKARRFIRSGLNGRAEISLKDIVVQPKALQKEILRDSLDKAGGEVKKLTFRHWKDLENFIKYKRKGSSLDLPGAVRVTRTADNLIFNRRG